MAFKDFPRQERGVQLLQRSLERGRLGHGYLFTGHRIEELEALARTLAKTLNCQHPVRKSGQAIDSCDNCPACARIDQFIHADTYWLRPESKSRIIRIEQIRELSREMQLKPTEAPFKVGVVVEADRLKTEAANAFLKTLEEPPPRSVLILLTTAPEKILETILSRCLRLNFVGEGAIATDPSKLAWLQEFGQMAETGKTTVLARYRLLGVLLKKLGEIKSRIEEEMSARSPLNKYPDAEKELQEKWEDELAAATEAEYRRQRSDMLSILQWWLRDVWLEAIALAGDHPGDQPAKSDLHHLLAFPQVRGAREVARKISAMEALTNLEVLEDLQRWLGTNVQEALALEVGLLKLRL